MASGSRTPPSRSPSTAGPWPPTPTEAFISTSETEALLVGFKKDGQHHLAELLKTFPFPGKLQIYPVERTIGELEALTERIGADRDALLSEGVDVRSLRTHDRDNVVEVGVPSPTVAAADAIARRYGPGARLVQDSPEPMQGGRRVAETLYGGLQITNHTTRRPCTSNVPAYREETAYLLTAGHCGLYRHRLARNGLFGPVAREAYHNNSRADALMIAVDRRRAVRRTTYVATNTRRSVTGVQALPSNPKADIGQEVCKYGYRTRLTCRAIEFSPYEVYYRARPELGLPAVTLVDQRLTRAAPRAATCRGDSGSPVFAPSTTQGAHMWASWGRRLSH